MLHNANVECAVLMRHTPRAKPELIIYTTGGSVAFEISKRYQAALRESGDDTAELLVVLREQYERGEIVPLASLEDLNNALALEQVEQEENSDKVGAQAHETPVSAPRKRRINMEFIDGEFYIE